LRHLFLLYRLLAGTSTIAGRLRMGLFLLLSFALHATALSYPVLFLTYRGEELLTLIVLDSPDVSGEEIARRRGREGNTKQAAHHKQSGPVKRPALMPEATNANRQEEFNRTPVETTAESQDVTIARYSGNGAEPQIDSSESVAVAGRVARGPGTTSGSSGGAGYGNGNGTGSTEGTEAILEAASYAYSPKPEYPHHARKEGQQGTVVLRVLVDQEGKSKSLEVSHSSGFEALDKAAMETVRRWRFHSARYGEKRVEMWVKIPIVFRLAD
jgi:TonB family protein